VHPSSALQTIGDSVFSWTRYSQTRQTGDYHNAALGLFLLIREEFGEQAIRDLIDIVNRIIIADVRARVRAFTFPHVGLELTPVTPSLVLNESLDVKQGLFVKSVEASGMGDRAGLKKKDVFTALGPLPSPAPPISNWLCSEPENCRRSC
jgi:hypothetical protein